MSEDTSIRVSEKLAEELYHRKGRSKSYEDFLWQLLERVDSIEEEETDSSHEPEPEPTTTAPEPETPTVDRARLVEEVPGSGELAETRAGIILDMYDVLRSEGTAEKSDMLAVVDVEEAEYASEASVWANLIKGEDTLRSLPGVKKPPSGRTEWRYTE